MFLFTYLLSRKETNEMMSAAQNKKLLSDLMTVSDEPVQTDEWT
jgi:hypothetical protein